MMLKGFILSGFLVTATTVLSANEKTICGQDDRVPSHENEVGRLLGKMADTGGCTVTMIGKTCAISAGHCKSTFGFAEFNTPPSSGRGRIGHPKSEDIYEVDKESIVSTYETIGNDWAVFRIRPNKITNKYPGDIQGHHQVAMDSELLENEEVSITGYGLDRKEPLRNLAQQHNNGMITRVRGSSVFHQTDTMGGNSGSSIIRTRDHKIIGIHTNGGCSRNGSGSNAGTLIAGNENFTKAILACLDYEREME
jgi:V8-like Glu-specific endopeptidase